MFHSRKSQTNIFLKKTRNNVRQLQQAVENFFQIFEVHTCDFENYNEDLVVRVLTDNFLWL